MASAELCVSDGWREALSAGGLGTFDAMMRPEPGECVSWHSRGQAYRVVLPGGEVVFLKRDAFTKLKDVLSDACRLRRPEPACIHELRALRRVAALGVRVPEVIAWGQRRRAGLPWRAVLVTRLLPGVALDELVKASEAGEDRRAALRLAGAAARKLYEAGLSWPDLLPKHFLLAGGEVGVLDLARMRRTRRAMKRFLPRQVGRFCAKLRARGADGGDVAALLEGLGRADILDGAARGAGRERRHAGGP